MERIRVISSDIASIGYDYENCILEIEFNSQSLYRYFNVPKSIYEGLMHADSHGKYFHRNIRDIYPTQKIS